MPQLEQRDWSTPGLMLALRPVPPSPRRCQEAASWAQIHQKLQDFSRGTQVIGKAWLGAPSYTLSSLTA